MVSAVAWARSVVSAVAWARAIYKESTLIYCLLKNYGDKTVVVDMSSGYQKLIKKIKHGTLPVVLVVSTLTLGSRSRLSPSLPIKKINKQKLN